MKLQFVSADNADLCELVAELDAFFCAQWGEAQASKYRAHHDLSKMACALVGTEDGVPAACGCWKDLGEQTAEIKRMYVRPAYRRAGAGQAVLAALEADAAARGCTRAVLETGTDMETAIAFYAAQGYRPVRNFGDFAGDTLCCCMEKAIKQQL